ncbi:cytochrome P450 [Clohesyomyces aquaticus]|uniref:Cytochrome P450 n=1 Tax=Clohesyomyces aquaticus TaxID=1231657 RepID=A0A1Y1YWY8_9PLEO|nr:cytochrome P450 [Clohesyomyces aquaticus]
MDLTAVVGAVAVLAGIHAIIQFLKALVSPLRSVPGPIAARFTDLWYFWTVYRGRFRAENIALHHKHGEIVRYGPNRYSICSSSGQKIIYGHGSKFPKSSWYRTWSNPNPDQWNLFADQNMKRHNENRRQFQSAYSMTSLVSYESYVDECADIFSQRLKEIARTGVFADMGHWLQCYAFDVIGLITYSKRLGFLDSGKDIEGVIAALEDHLRYGTLVGIFPWLHPYLTPLRNWLAGSAGAGRTYVLKFTQERIAEYQKAEPKTVTQNGEADPGTAVDFLTKFFSKHAKDPGTFTMYHLAMGCGSNMVAGSDTTAISLSVILYYLLKNRPTFDALRKEIDSHPENGESSNHTTFKQSQDMPYLQAVIKEALRLHPATGLPLERVVPPGGATICEKFFPEGTIVGTNTWVVHRDPSLWGADADDFKPERWLIEDKEKLSCMERNWIPFGLGSRNCIGRHISFLEISKLIPRLVRNFNFELDEELKGRMWNTTGYWFVKPRNFRLKVSVRQD